MTNDALIALSSQILPGYGLQSGDVLKLMIDAISEGGITSITIVSANGISGSVAYNIANAAITLSLGNITPNSIMASGSISGSNLSGNNTGDQTIILTGDVSGAGTGSFTTTISNLAVTNAKLAGSISSSKLIGTDISTVGTINNGTWQGTLIGGAYGGTGVNNGASTITLGGNVTYTGPYSTNFTVSNNTNLTLPISGTLINSTSNSVGFTGGTINGVTIGGSTACQIQGYCPTNYQTGTSYTLAIGDAGQRISLSNSSGIILTVPSHSSVAFPAETEIILRQGGAGQVSIVPGSGVTINSVGGNLKLSAQYAYATLKQSSTTDTWDLFGSLSS